MEEANRVEANRVEANREEAKADKVQAKMDQVNKVEIKIVVKAQGKMVLQVEVNNQEGNKAVVDNDIILNKYLFLYN